MKKIYNEGRVVGLSSYEIYVKHHLDSSPDVPPLTETEWLASLLGEGYAMVLKFPEVDLEDSLSKVVEIPLPSSSYLRAANTIRADIFLGEGIADEDDTWLVNVTSYGPLISNNSESSPASGRISATDLPHDDIEEFPSVDTRAKITEYLGIVDGVVLQSGTWFNNEYGSPSKDFSPDLDKSPILRFVVTKNITHRPYILLSGFENSLILRGMSGKDGSADPTIGSRVNGEFLGPYTFPWANKITFSAPPASLLTSDVDVTTERIRPSSVLGTRYVTQVINKTQLGKSVSLVDDEGFSLLRPFDTGTSEGELQYLGSEFNWNQLLNVLANRGSMNVLGQFLNSLITDQLPNNYIEFGSGTNKLRFYISNQQPSGSDIPVGSIGIGW